MNGSVTKYALWAFMGGVVAYGITGTWLMSGLLEHDVDQDARILSVEEQVDNSAFKQEVLQRLTKIETMLEVIREQ